MRKKRTSVSALLTQELQLSNEGHLEGHTTFTLHTAVVANFTRAFDLLPSLDPSCFRRQTTHRKHSEVKAATVTCHLSGSHPCISTLNLEFQLTNYLYHCLSIQNDRLVFFQRMMPLPKGLRSKTTPYLS